MNSKIRFFISFTTLALFHVSEFVVHHFLHPRKTNIHNFLLSKNYCFGYFLVFVTTFAQWKLLPNVFVIIEKYTDIIGLLFIGLGLLLRIIAMIQLGRNYAHYIYLHKNSYNKLVTTGIFRIIRHPCYTGFFLFQIGIQILLENAIGVILFSVALHVFFNQRVTYEERMLCRHFPDEYPEYMKKVKISFL